MPTSPRLSKVVICSAIIALSITLNYVNLPEDVKQHLLAILEKLRLAVPVILE